MTAETRINGGLEDEPDIIRELRAIAALSVPEINVPRDLNNFLSQHHVVEVVGAVLNTYGESILVGHQIKVGERGTPPHYFSATSEHDLNRIILEGIDEVKEGYLRQQYRLTLPVYRGIGQLYKLDRRVPVALSVSDQTQALLDFVNPKPPAAPRPSYTDGVWVLKQGLGELLLHVDTSPPF